MSLRQQDERVVTSNAELFTVRDAMRELNRIIDRIDRGEIEKAILTKHGKMVVAVVPLRGAGTHS